MVKNTVEMTDNNFQDLIASNPILVIDSWAPWCGPCKSISPVFDKLTETHSDKITFAKLNTDENNATMRQLKIMSIPTFFVFQNGELKDRWTGANVNKLQKTIKKLYEN